MADISQYVRAIELATRGEEVRDAIVSALNAINESALGLFDEEPIEGSAHAVKSGGLYTAIQSLSTAISGKQGSLVFDTAPTEGSGNPVTSGGVYDAIQAVDIDVDAQFSLDSARPVENRRIKIALDGKQDRLEFDSEPTEDSENPVTSGGVYDALQNVEVEVDSALSDSSTHAVENRVIKAALDGKQETLSFDTAPTANSTKPVTSGGIYTALQNVQITVDSSLSDSSTRPVQNKIIKQALDGKQATLSFDTAPTANSEHPVTSGGVYTALQNVEIDVDDALSSLSENPVQNKVIKQALDGKEDVLTFDTTPTEDSEHPVTSGGIYTAVGDVASDLSDLTDDVGALAATVQALASGITWKPSVATYADIATTYTSPALGYTVGCQDTGAAWYYDGSQWVHIFSVPHVSLTANEVRQILES